MNRLGTGSLSSNTLQRGMELAAQPLVNILGVKEEPTDEDEAEMQAEIQDIFHSLMAEGLNGGSIPVDGSDEEDAQPLMWKEPFQEGSPEHVEQTQAVEDTQQQRSKPTELQEQPTQPKPTELLQEVTEPKQQKPAELQAQPKQQTTELEEQPKQQKATELEQPKQQKPAKLEQPKQQTTELEQPKQQKPAELEQPKQQKPAELEQPKQQTTELEQPKQQKATELEQPKQPTRKRQQEDLMQPAAKRLRGKTTPCQPNEQNHPAADQPLPPVPGADQTVSPEPTHIPTNGLLTPEQPKKSTTAVPIETCEQPQEPDSTMGANLETPEQPKATDEAKTVAPVQLTQSNPSPGQTPATVSPGSQQVPQQATTKPPPEQKQQLQPVQRPSDSAVDKRLRRVMAANADGEFRISEKIRELWSDPAAGRGKVLKLFAECNWDKDVFAKRFSLKSSMSKEHEVHIPFEYLSKEEMADERNMQTNRATVDEEQQFEDGSMDHIGLNMDLNCTSAAARAAENPAAKEACEKEMQKMIQKIKNLHDELESASEQLGDLQTQGVVDGWDEIATDVDLCLLETKKKPPG
ncbi:unnamed protein product [Symbiodinium microadriaticum]|nr:unnamed protein product [Symbiodinium microadriaticum]CAE7307527.1 unnamed protein product [Symbiodinium sp. KB8]